MPDCGCLCDSTRLRHTLEPFSDVRASVEHLCRALPTRRDRSGSLPVGVREPLPQTNVQFNAPSHDFRAARNDVRPQFAETIADEIGILIDALWAIDAIAYFAVNREILTVERTDQFQV